MINEISQIHDNCVGCGACVASCPTSCISMSEKQGFYYPKIDKKGCIECGKCTNVCVALNDSEYRNKPLEWYASYANPEVIEKHCTSGGICYEISKKYLEEGNLVYAAAFDSKWNLLHRRVEDISDLHMFSGSKYAQSKISKEIYLDIANNLKNNRKCLFIGTPCQVAAVITYMRVHRVDMIGLASIDFMCHGVPSPSIVRRFIEYLEKREGKHISFYNFRSKSHGWGSIERTVEFDDGTEKVTPGTICPLHSWFGHHLSIRKSCFACLYRTKERVSDITVADFWGIRKYYPEIETKQGISAVQINSEKGRSLFIALCDSNRLHSEEVSEQSIWDRKTALKNFTKPQNYNEFWNDAEKLSIKQLIRKYPPQTLYGYFKQKIKYLLGR